MVGKTTAVTDPDRGPSGPLGPLGKVVAPLPTNGPTAIRYTMGVGQAAVNATDTPIPYNRTTTMSITIPSSNEIGSTMERIARAIAIAIAMTITIAHTVYQAGYRSGRFIHNLSDWLASAIHHPMESATRAANSALSWADRVLATPEPTPSLLTLLGAEILTDAEMAAEISRYDASSQRKRPATVRRKPAAVTKVAVGA